MNGKLTGRQARHLLLLSQLPNSVLAKIWSLSDIDQDGQSDKEDFCLAMYLFDYKLAGSDCPGWTL